MLHLIFFWILFWTFKWKWSIVYFFSVIFSQDLLSVFGLNKRLEGFHIFCSEIVLELCVLEVNYCLSFQRVWKFGAWVSFGWFFDNFPNFLIRLVSNLSIGISLLQESDLRFYHLIHYFCLYFNSSLIFLNMSFPHHPVNFKYKRSSKDPKLRFVWMKIHTQVIKTYIPLGQTTFHYYF